jgi:phage gpG-like protein
MNVQFEDNSAEMLSEFDQAKGRGLEKVGLLAEGYAKKRCKVRTGRLRNSITHAVQDDDVYIGTNVEYGAYVELGTGVHYPTGRKNPWVYKDSEGNFHKTSGSKAQPFLRPACTEHTGTYKNALEGEFKNA